jgi:hypothetical protein
MLEFYYLTKKDDQPEEQKSFNPPKIMGYLGITPMSLVDPRGIFHQLPTCSPIFGLELRANGGKAIIGDYDKSIVPDSSKIHWYSIDSGSNSWNVAIKSL